jgi:hypothetical protein
MGLARAVVAKKGLDHHRDKKDARKDEKAAEEQKKDDKT